MGSLRGLGKGVYTMINSMMNIEAKLASVDIATIRIAVEVY